MSVGIAKNKPNGGKEVTLARPIAPNDHIVFWRERLDNGLVLVAAVKTEISRVFGRRISEPSSRHTHLLKPWMIICLINMVDRNLADDPENTGRSTPDAHCQTPQTSCVKSLAMRCCCLSCLKLAAFLRQKRVAVRRVLARRGRYAVLGNKDSPCR